MRTVLPPWVLRSPGERDGRQGWYILPGPLGSTLRCLVSDGSDWEACGLPPPAWEHVSVSLKNRCPTWREMEFVRECFWTDDETVMQFSVPRSRHINLHQYCLHMWRPIGVEVTLPHHLAVGPANEREIAALRENGIVE